MMAGILRGMCPRRAPVASAQLLLLPHGVSSSRTATPRRMPPCVQQVKIPSSSIANVSLGTACHSKTACQRTAASGALAATLNCPAVRRSSSALNVWRFSVHELTSSAVTVSGQPTASGSLVLSGSCRLLESSVCPDAGDASTVRRRLGTCVLLLLGLLLQELVRACCLPSSLTSPI
jgi:hypothetical protein